MFTSRLTAQYYQTKCNCKCRLAFLCNYNTQFPWTLIAIRSEPTQDTILNLTKYNRQDSEIEICLKEAEGMHPPKTCQAHVNEPVASRKNVQAERISDTARSSDLSTNTTEPEPTPTCSNQTSGNSNTRTFPIINHLNSDETTGMVILFFVKPWRSSIYTLL